LITLPELLEDKRYKQFFLTPPKMLKPLPGQKPWRVLVQRQPGGPWAKKELETYADGFRVIRHNIKSGTLYDGTIQSRGIAYGPPVRIAKITKGGKPVWHTRDGKILLDADGNRIQKTVTVEWKPKLDAAEEPHDWCTLCRRPTVFRWFRSHHALRNVGLQELVDPNDRRCTICGAREDFIRSTRGNARPPGFNPVNYLTKPKRPRARK
jgi:hypothetical protein